MKVNILANRMFVHFHASLDAQMKELKSIGKYQAKKLKSRKIACERKDCLEIRTLSSYLICYFLYRVSFCIM